MSILDNMVLVNFPGKRKGIVSSSVIIIAQSSGFEYKLMLAAEVKIVVTLPLWQSWELLVKVLVVTVTTRKIWVV